MISWLIVVMALFLVYMGLESWLAEYHAFKVMEHQRYLAWLEQERKNKEV